MPGTGRGLIERLGASVASGIAYLARAQDPSGSWSDFWLPVGTSDEWVTAYVGICLDAASRCAAPPEPTRAAAGAAARLAAAWLLDHRRPLRGWGYNGTVPPDADSTAHAVSCIARAGLAVPEDAVSRLQEYAVAGEGFRTYRWADPDHRWTRPCPDVTAAVLLALRDVRALDEEGLRAMFAQTLAPAQAEDGLWHGYWWTTPGYATAMAVEVWHAAGRPPLARPVGDLPVSSAFDLGCAVLAAARAGDPADAAAALAAAQNADGGWPAAPILLVPPPWESLRRGTVVTGDARRLFVTATAVRAMAAALDALPQTRGAWRSASRLRGRGKAVASDGQRRRLVRSPLGQTLDDLVQHAAHALEFAQPEWESACFAELTRESLASPCPWPAPQLSSLSGGAPLEFSVTVAPRARPALRYAVEVGDPFLPPHARAASGVAAIDRTAARLGYAAAWRRVRPAVSALVAADLRVPEGLRFWVWGGMDQEAAEAPALKIYLSLLHAELGGARKRVEAALGEAAIPVRDDTGDLLDALEESGFLHEMGFALGPGGRIACKVYAELPGWRRSLVQAMLERAGLGSDPQAVCPEIPGVLTESLAAKQRAGIALRLDPATGAVRDLTIAVAFPTPMLTPGETRSRVEAWIRSHGWDGTAYDALCEVLLDGWRPADDPHPRLHSLVTRTTSRTGDWATIYLRPLVASNPNAVGNGVTAAAGARSRAGKGDADHG